MKEFVLINETRIRKSTIKRYLPYREDRITIYYSPSRNKLDYETHTFTSKEDRDDTMDYLDLNFL